MMGREGRLDSKGAGEGLCKLEGWKVGLAPKSRNYAYSVLITLR